MIIIIIIIIIVIIIIIIIIIIVVVVVVVIAIVIIIIIIIIAVAVCHEEPVPHCRLSVSAPLTEMWKVKIRLPDDWARFHRGALTFPVCHCTETARSSCLLLYWHPMGLRRQ